MAKKSDKKKLKKAEAKKAADAPKKKSKVTTAPSAILKVEAESVAHDAAANAAFDTEKGLLKLSIPAGQPGRAGRAGRQGPAGTGLDLSKVSGQNGNADCALYVDAEGNLCFRRGKAHFQVSLTPIEAPASEAKPAAAPKKTAARPRARAAKQAKTARVKN